MAALYGLILSAVLIQVSWAFKEICCDWESGCFTNSPPYGHLPLPQCPLDLNPSYTLYTREFANDGFPISRWSIPATYSPNRRTVFLIHGWLGAGDVTFWLRDARRRFLEREDINVIVVGWGAGSINIWYPQSASNTRAVASETALIANRLIDRAGANSKDFWCVGHSLGAHTCGITGMNTHFGRVTGLDPAGPGWEDYDIMAGINPTSADFVDIIHTDGKSLLLPLGTMRPLGHMDFYPNGGHHQPGCITYYNQQDNEPNENAGELFACSHDRACSYFEESLRMDACIAYEKCSDPDNIPGSCAPCGDGEACAIMGYSAEGSGEHGLYYLQTSRGWFFNPFCQW